MDQRVVEAFLLAQQVSRGGELRDRVPRILPAVDPLNNVHVYTSPPVSLPITITTPSLPQLYTQTFISNHIRQALREPLLNPQYLIHAAHAARDVNAAAAAAMERAENAIRQQQSQAQQQSVSRRTHSSTNTAYNQLKDTVVRVQQRKRQREHVFDDDGYQADTDTADSSDVGIDSLSSDSESETTRASKVRRRGGGSGGAQQHQRQQQRPQHEHELDEQHERADEAAPTTSSSNDSSESSTTSTAATATSSAPSASANNRCPSNNQQITGMVRQNEHRNCQHCLPQPPPAHQHPTFNPFNLFRVIPQIYEIPAQPVMIARVPPQQNPQPQPAAPQNRFINTTFIPTGVMLHNNFGSIPEGILNSQQTATDPALLQNFNRFMSNATEQFMMRERAFMDRHQHLFTHISEDMPIGISLGDIEKHSLRVPFDKTPEEGEEPERCTVCLDDFVRGNNIRLLRCGHIFHPECIDKWLSLNKKCPVCRMDIDKLGVETKPATGVVVPPIAPVQ
ncbi:unnamed protein product [Caenorhabditis bovis]|uniref:RING-type E3 ubiquitin transferase n=1 Tax=Caenorhabditis bovis TaxID=2654633 RepID=A0A8S1F7T5_9PELO|nr:unnamed protein product [Caenorhabditis bovis]